MGPLIEAGDAGVRTFGAPLRYHQGRGALDQVGDVVGLAHRRAVLVADSSLPDAVVPRLEASLAAGGVDALTLLVHGEVTAAHISRLVERARPAQATVVVAAGGGKALDLGKGVARALAVAMVSVPTISSNDGPTSRVIALYDDMHLLIDTPTMRHNPETVIVDTALVSTAPVRFLLSGIGDALAKRFEAAACARGTGTNSYGTRPLQIAGIIAEGCYRILLSHGEAAVAAVEEGRHSDAVEQVVEAAVLMSGLAFENGGLSLAHAMTRGLMVLPGAARHLHGYHVAYGLLVQLAHEGAEQELKDVHAFFRAVGLPCTLAALDATRGSDVVRALADAVVRSPHVNNCVPEPTVESVARAIDTVESYESEGT